jgi:hypothetical protein
MRIAIAIRPRKTLGHLRRLGKTLEFIRIFDLIFQTHCALIHDDMVLTLVRSSGNGKVPSISVRWETNVLFVHELSTAADSCSDPPHCRHSLIDP